MAIQHRHGKSAVFTCSDAAASTFSLSSGCDDLGWDRQVDMAEVTTFGENDRTHIPGLRGANMSFSGHFNSTQVNLLDAMLGHSTSSVCTYGPAGLTAGYHKYEFSAFLTQLAIGSPVGDKVSMSGAFLVDGVVTSTNY